jgi:hypothetical protein
MFSDRRSDQNVYCFPDFVLKVSGIPSPMKIAVDTLFRLFPRTTEVSRRQIDMLVLHMQNDRVPVLPECFTQYLSNPEEIAEPKRVSGENDLIGFIHAHDGVFTACHYNPEHSRIELVEILRSNGKENGDIGTIPVCITSVLVPLLREILLDNQQILFHSAAIACPDGTGILLFADSGGGKTTTSLSLMRLGARLLGDDLVMMGDGNSALQLHSFPEPLNLTDQTMAFFSELADLKSTAGSGSKTVVFPQDVYGPLCFQEKVPLHVAYIVHKSTGTPHVESLPPHESLGYLVRAHTFARCQSISRAALDKMYQMLDSVNFYRLYTGNDPAALGKWLLNSAHDHAHDRFTSTAALIK